MSSALEKWLKRVEFFRAEFPFGPVATQLDVEGNISDKTDENGNTIPAYVSPTRVMHYRMGKKHGTDVDIWGGERFYYNGVEVPRHYIMDPKSLTSDEVMKNPNSEVKRVGMEIIGFENLIKNGTAKLVKEDDKTGYGLYKIKIGGQDDMAVVRVLDGTPDHITGERRIFFLKVPPNTKTPSEGVAWTFYEDEKSYQPEVET